MGNISLMKMDNFNWNQYIENYQDLQEGGINSEKTALWHYKKYGINEKEIILLNNGNGYGKIIVNKEEKFIKIIVVPCLYCSFNSDKESDIKIFSFDFDSKELVREIDNEKLKEILKDKDYYIG